MEMRELRADNKDHKYQNTDISCSLAFIYNYTHMTELQNMLQIKMYYKNKSWMLLNIELLNFNVLCEVVHCFMAHSEMLFVI